ncbi:MAG TPA: zinc ABC transporter substrate-binding protein [Nakamurella sp.]
MTGSVRRVGLAVRALLAVAVVVLLAACGSTTSAAGGGASGSLNSATQPIAVVTSTNVWGDLVAQVGGQFVAVRPLLTDPSADPHSFEPSAQAQLAVSKAELLVMNGGGYDDWMTTLIDASGSVAPVVNAAQLYTAGPLSNEHVWYDLPTVQAVAQQVATKLSDLRPEQAGDFRANADAFTRKIAGLTAKVQAIKAAHEGTAIAVTEPVPLYLTEAAGLVDKTPERFSKAIEDGTDVPPTVLNDTLALFTGRQVAALVYNAQTASPETETVLNAAKQSDIRVVPVTETLPAGKDYLSWMDETITALAAALDSSAPESSASESSAPASSAPASSAPAR